MRVIDCDCGVTLSAANDDELAECVLEHAAEEHPDLELDGAAAAALVEQKAYTATDS